jgi:hypothetical protein
MTYLTCHSNGSDMGYRFFRESIFRKGYTFDALMTGLLTLIKNDRYENCCILLIYQ